MAVILFSYMSFYIPIVDTMNTVSNLFHLICFTLKLDGKTEKFCKLKKLIGVII